MWVRNSRYHALEALAFAVRPSARGLRITRALLDGQRKLRAAQQDAPNRLESSEADFQRSTNRLVAKSL